MATPIPTAIGRSDSFSSGNIPRDVKGHTAIDTKSAETEPDVAQPAKLRDDPEARAAFLATFSHEEAKAIMRKVDMRFFVLIGLMFMVKNVNRAKTVHVHVYEDLIWLDNRSIMQMRH